MRPCNRSAAAAPAMIMVRTSGVSRGGGSLGGPSSGELPPPRGLLRCLHVRHGLQPMEDRRLQLTVLLRRRRKTLRLGQRRILVPHALVRALHLHRGSRSQESVAAVPPKGECRKGRCLSLHHASHCLFLSSSTRAPSPPHLGKARAHETDTHEPTTPAKAKPCTYASELPQPPSGDRVYCCLPRFSYMNDHGTSVHDRHPRPLKACQGKPWTHVQF